MRLVLISLAASLVAATPALANETRVEARGGIAWSAGESEAIAGVAAGYDFDVGPVAFAGAEVTADKLLTDNTKVSFGFNGRVGADLPTVGKLYAVGGYNTEFCDFCDGTWTGGVGYQRSFLNIYGKIEYRHFFVTDSADDVDAVAVGLGVKF